MLQRNPFFSRVIEKAMTARLVTDSLLAISKPDITPTRAISAPTSSSSGRSRQRHRLQHEPVRQHLERNAQSFIRPLSCYGLAPGEGWGAFLEEMSDTLLEILRNQRSLRFRVRQCPGFGERLEVRLIYLPLDHSDRAW
ncbi:hypothetical protein ABIF90_007266 [Bradyrhizobium japonicum]